MWNGIIHCECGHIWYVLIANLTLVPKARLSVLRADTFSVQMAWATNFSDHVLEYATGMALTEWRTVTNAIGITGDGFSVTVAADTPKRFYRMRKP